jgi:hypothetical protein
MKSLAMSVRFAFFAAAGSLIAACGGGTMPNGPVVNDPGSGTTPPPTQLVNVKVTVTVPSRNTQRVRPGYVSVNTQSLVIQLASVNGSGVTGVNPTTINTVSRARGCKAVAGQTVCTATTTGSPGEDVFSVTTYADTNANGAVLSVGSVQAKVRSGDGLQISNKLSLTLDSVIASLQLSVTPAYTKRGKPATAAVALNAFDASGAQIVGPSEYTAPIALAIDGDGNDSFALHSGGKSGSSLNFVKPTSGITLSYDGNGQASSITLAATVDGPSIGASTNFALHGKQPPPPVGTIYALNLGANDGQGATVTEYSGKASGNSAPETTLQLDSKLYARSIAVDASGQLYVGYYASSSGASSSNGTPDSGNEIAIYAKGASGNVQPTAVITADTSKSAQTTIFPAFMTFDGSGDLVTYGATTVDGNAGNDAVLIYQPGANGATAPKDGWSFSAPKLNYPGPTGLGLDAGGNFYVAGAMYTSLGPDYGTFVAPASDYDNPNVNPSRTIPWNTESDLNPTYTTDVALATSGEIFMGNTTLVTGSGSYPSCQGRTNVFASGTGGSSTKPLRILTFTEVFTKNLQCLSPSNPLVPFFPSIALYGTTLFVADDFNNAIDVYPANASGTIKASLQITGAATQLNAPVALVITSVSGQAKARPAQFLVHSTLDKKG